MADARPFPMLEQLFAHAEDIANDSDFSHMIDPSHIEKKLEAVLER
ncbi:MAG TPA: hypothetical protein PLR83_02660 [Pyrinomonadaceae bacterium]|nr:hypothetical protein [Pyrinomonadaceae bacterium]